MTTERPIESSYDAIVVGARCAGAATALLLARKGLRVLAIDRSPYGSDTPSTHALMRPGVMQLSRWGLLGRIVAAETPAVRSTTFRYGDESVDVEIKPRHGVDALYAPRRTVLDPILVDAALEAGADVRHRRSLTGLVRDDDGRVCGATVRSASGKVAEVRAGIVIGADGTRSSVARHAGAVSYRRAEHHTSVLYGYWEGLPTDGYQWHYSPGVAIGTIPTNHGETCVFVSVPPERFDSELRFDISRSFYRVIEQCSPDLASAIGSGARATSTLRGMAGEPGFFRKAWGPGWALVGDAGYFKDPLTAHGISDSLRDAELLANAVARGTDAALAEYQATRDELSSEFFAITDAVASFQWSLAEVKTMHRAMSKAMNREADAMAVWEAAATRAA